MNLRYVVCFKEQELCGIEEMNEKDAKGFCQGFFKGADRYGGFAVAFVLPEEVEEMQEYIEEYCKNPKAIRSDIASQIGRMEEKKDLGDR